MTCAARCLYVIVGATLLSGCVRAISERPVDARADTSGDVIVGDATVDRAFVDGVVDATVDTASVDAAVHDTVSDLGTVTLLFSLQTTALSPTPFDPSVVKTGLPLRWDFGDGHVADTNSASHLYNLAGTKTVQVFSADGPLGVTALDVSGDELLARIPLELNQLTMLQRLDLSNNQLSIYPEGALLGLYAIEAIDLSNNLLGQSDLDAILTDLAIDRDQHSASGVKVLDLAGNAPPSYLGCTRVSDLVSSYNWQIAVEGC